MTVKAFRSRSWRSYFHYHDIRIIDPHRTCLSAQVRSKTAPAPLLRRRHQPTLDRVAMDGVPQVSPGLRDLGFLPTARLKGCGSWLRAGPKFAKTGQTWGTLGSRLSAHLQSYTSGRNVPTRPTKTRKRCMPSTCNRSLPRHSSKVWKSCEPVRFCNSRTPPS